MKPPRTLCAVAAALFLAAANAAAVQAQGPDSLAELEGLWVAKKRFGPDARGPLTIIRTDAGYVADFLGVSIPVRAADDELTFELPNGDAAFRGRLDTGGTVRGFWLQNAVGSFTPSARTPAATPVTLVAAGRDRWSGEVRPLDDTQTFHLLVIRRTDGTLAALLRNLERDYGSLLGVRSLLRSGSTITLAGARRLPAPDAALITGSWDSALKVITLNFPYRGGSYDFRRDGGETSTFYPRGKNPARYVYHPPPQLDDGWTTASLNEEGIERAAAERLVQRIIDMVPDSTNAPQLHSLLIARRGRLVLEEYFHGYHRDRLHNTRSGSKSVTATIAGAAMLAGAPLRLSTPVYQAMNDGAFPPGLEARRRAMTLEHLLTMSSGYFCDDNNDDAPGNESRLWEQEEPDFAAFTLKLPMASAPGEAAVYCSVNTNLALAMVGRAAGESPLYLFDRLVAGPLQIRHYAWRMDRAGNPYGGGGMELLPRDYMKFGQLMLNDGRWDGRRILSGEFIAHAVAPLVVVNGVREYGLAWWPQQHSYDGRTVRGFAALGNGGQIVMVFPDLELVIATNGGSYASGGWRYIGGELIPNQILPAVRDLPTR